MANFSGGWRTLADSFVRVADVIYGAFSIKYVAAFSKEKII